jgi:PAS domain S-box-containing protein
LNVFEAYRGIYECRLLPAYASFIIDRHLEHFAKEQVSLSLQLNVPLMTSLMQRYSEEQITQLAVSSTREYLQYLSENRALDQLRDAMDKWSHDRLEVVGKMQVLAQDITLINFVRAQNLKKFIPLYTSDVHQAIEIAMEIDRVILGANTTAVDLFIDILKEKIAEQSNLATKVIEASPAITFLLDTRSFSQLFVSRNVTEVLGYLPEEIIAMGDKVLFELVHPDDLPSLFAHLKKTIADNLNKTSIVEFRLRHKDQTYRWLRTYEVIFKRDAQGNPLELLGKTFEVTHEKETAIALARSEKQLLEAQSIAHVGSYEWNIAENHSKNTAEVFRIFELTEEQRFEQFLSYVHPNDVEKVKQAIEKSFATGYYECEYRYVKNNNEKVIWSVGRVEFRNDAPYRMIGTVQDVTKIKKIEHELVLKSQELALSNESLRQFAYVASHDMKEPLRKIMVFADMVLNREKTNLSERSVEQLQKMQASGRKLYQMVEDILSFSMLEAKEDRDEVELAAIIEEVRELLDERIREKNARIRYQALPKVKVIPSQFRHLFQNLLSNSLKFSRNDESPIIKIEAEITPSPTIFPPKEAPGYLEICVEDNGIGFPQDASEKIFELFSRYHSRSQYEGTGLGLSIGRRIVNNHDGVIKASPAKNGGALFRIVIPQEV